MNEPELKEKVESVLFSAGKKLPIAEIARLCGKRLLPDIETALNELREDYLHKGGSLVVLNDGDEWRITVKERYMSYARKITTKVELTKTYMETLAVVAYKSPILQSAIIKIRTNKAYDHLAQLEQMGYITRTKHGRTKLIRLAQKFFDYFDVPQEALKQKFEPVREMESDVAAKEAEKEFIKQKIEEKKVEMLEKERETKSQQTEEIIKVSKEIGEMPKIQLETYNTSEDEVEIPAYPEGTEVELEKLGELEIYQPEKHKKKKKAKKVAGKEAKKEKIKKHAVKGTKERIASESKSEPLEAEDSEKEWADGETTPISKEEVEKTLKKAPPMFSGGISEEVQHKIDEKIAELIHPTKNGGTKEMKHKEELKEESDDADNEEESDKNESDTSEEDKFTEKESEEETELENNKPEETTEDENPDKTVLSDDSEEEGELSDENKDEADLEEETAESKTEESGESEEEF